MKIKLLFIAPLFGLALSAAAIDAEIPLAVPAVVTAGATSNINQVIDCTQQASVCVQASFRLHSASSNNVQNLVFVRSNNRTSWGTETKTVSLTPNSTNTVSVITNLPTYGCRFMKLVSWANTDGGAVVTNTAVTYAVKTGAP